MRTFDTNAASTPDHEYAAVHQQRDGEQRRAERQAELHLDGQADVDRRLPQFGDAQPDCLAGAAHEPSFNNSFLPSIYQKYLGTNDVPQIDEHVHERHARTRRPGTASVANSTSYNFAGTVTKILSRHTLKIGGEHRRYYDNFLNPAAANIMNFMVNPLYQFQGDWGFGAIEGRVLGLGQLPAGHQQPEQHRQAHHSRHEHQLLAAFIQDDWKVTSKLTVNLGMRWDNERPTTERGDKLFFWDPSYPSLFKINPGYNLRPRRKAAACRPMRRFRAGPQHGQVRSRRRHDRQHSEGIPLAYAADVQATSSLPRVSAWRIRSDKDTVVRAYGGKMYLPTPATRGSYATSNGNVALSDQAFAGWHASTDGGRTYISTWANPFPLASMFTRLPVTS